MFFYRQRNCPIQIMSNRVDTESLELLIQKDTFMQFVSIHIQNFLAQDKDSLCILKIVTGIKL